MWRNTGYGGKFLGADYRAMFPILIFFLHMRWWTFWVAVAGVVVMAVVAKFGYTVPVALRSVRMAISGPVKFAVALKRAPSRKHYYHTD